MMMNWLISTLTTSTPISLYWHQKWK